MKKTKKTPMKKKPAKKLTKKTIPKSRQTKLVHIAPKKPAPLKPEALKYNREGLLELDVQSIAGNGVVLSFVGMKRGRKTKVVLTIAKR